EAVPETLQDSQENIEQKVQQIDKLTEKELYGYDAYDVRNKNRLSIGNGKEANASKAVALLEQAEREGNVLPLCKVFLRRFGVISETKSEIPRSRLFDDTGTSNTVRPTEMKYAVLRLLGVDEDICRKNCGYTGNNRITFAELFNADIRRIENARRLFPLKNRTQFPEVETAINRITKHSNIPVDKIFKENGIPQLNPSQVAGEQGELSLVAALSILAMALEKGVPITIAYANDTSPFSDTVLTLVEKKRDEKKAQQVQPESKLG
ncbi:MAG: hypothetical protein AAB899_00880, partial [Patescibacteria group bacterium]